MYSQFANWLYLNNYQFMKRFSLWLFLTAICFIANAQIMSNQLNKGLYDSRIKLVDEFFDRFNGKEGHPDISNKDKYYRKKNLMFVFNGRMFKSKEDEKYKELQNFIDTVIANKTNINYSDTTWFAKAICHGKLKGKEVDFTLYLNVEHRKEDMYKWVIAKAEGDVFKLKPSLKSDKIMLMPDDHETNFMSLHRITTEKDDLISCYMQRNYPLDETSVFLSDVYNGLLDIEYVKDLQFVFHQVPGYVFRIKFIERDTNNTGWLITSCDKVTENEKEKFLNYLYNKTQNEK